ncbi:MAG: hypothetical protein PHU85_10060, partial [Phycisphaerae bacterium]|nr:hypothetical protein [Phycisphaerae bacterium]
MFYVALTFWLLVALLEAFAIFKLWEGIVRPRWINLVLLPGTIVSETAHFLAALLTGAPVREAKLVSDESVGEGQPEKSTGVPVLSPLLLALLPILAGLTVILLLYCHFDDSLVNKFAISTQVAAGGTPLPFDPAELPRSISWHLGEWFRAGKTLLTLSEHLIRALPFQDFRHTWKAWVFLYLTGCLAIRMVPLRGNLRSGMAAMVLIGGLAAGLGWLLPNGVDASLHTRWPL